MLAKDYFDEQRLWDWRFYQLVATAAATAGAKEPITPSAVFPSLEPWNDRVLAPQEVDDEQAYQNIRNIMEAAAGFSAASQD